MATESFGRRLNTKWKLQWNEKIVGDSESITVGQAILVGKILGRDSWIDCLPYIGPEACAAWLVILTMPQTEAEAMTPEQFMEHMKKFAMMSLDDLFNCLILE